MVLSELLVALAIVLTMSAGFVWVADEVQAQMGVQPELADLAQRVRVGVDVLAREISLAGAGPYRGDLTHGDGYDDVVGPLARWVPAIYPDRRVATSGVTALFEDSAITLLRVPEGAAQGVLASAMRADEVVGVKRDGVCPLGKMACGFVEGQRAMLFDRRAGFDLFTVGDVGESAFSHQPSVLTRGYRPEDGAVVSEVVPTTFYFDEGRRQIRKTMGAHTDVPVVDQVVGLQFQYYGDPFPPEGPRPAAGEGNCLYDELGHARLGAIGGGGEGLVLLRGEQFSDGPFCGEGVQRFDADLYRVRRVRVVVRLQVAAESLRGRDPLLFRVPGASTSVRRQVPDLEMRFDVAPVNVQLR